MEIIPIGCYGRYAPPDNATNCYIVKLGDKNIIIDFGAGSLSLLQKYIDIADIHAIILTHLHYDHISDIFTLAYMQGYKGFKKIVLYAPETPAQLTEELSSVGKNAFDIRKIALGKADISGVEVEFIPSSHPVETYSLRINDEDKTLVYTSDCSDSELLRDICLGADLVIGDACILERNHNGRAPHVSVKQLAEAVPAASRLYLAHLSAGEERDILAEARLYHNNCSLVELGKRISL